MIPSSLPPMRFAAVRPSVPRPAAVTQPTFKGALDDTSLEPDNPEWGAEARRLMALLEEKNKPLAQEYKKIYTENADSLFGIYIKTGLELAKFRNKNNPITKNRIEWTKILDLVRSAPENVHMTQSPRVAITLAQVYEDVARQRAEDPEEPGKEPLEAINGQDLEKAYLWAEITAKLLKRNNPLPDRLRLQNAPFSQELKDSIRRKAHEMFQAEYDPIAISSEPDGPWGEEARRLMTLIGEKHGSLSRFSHEVINLTKSRWYDRNLWYNVLDTFRISDADWLPNQQTMFSRTLAHAYDDAAHLRVKGPRESGKKTVEKVNEKDMLQAYLWTEVTRLQNIRLSLGASKAYLNLPNRLLLKNAPIPQEKKDEIHQRALELLDNLDERSRAEQEGDAEKPEPFWLNPDDPV